jgi:putative ABC transport system permease protein
MFRGNVKMAWAAIRAARWRSFLTMLGIIIGVVSVVTIVSLGEGVKQQVAKQIKSTGENIVTVIPGNIEANTSSVTSGGIGARGTQTLSDRDYAIVDQTEGIAQAVPFSTVSGVPQVEDISYPQASVFGTNQDMADVLQLKVEFGVFFSDAEQNRQVAVIGKRVAERLFQENVPTGRTLTVRGEDFIVRGILEETKTSSFSAAPNYNEAILIPYPVAARLNNGVAPIYQIVAKPDTGVTPEQAKAAISERLYFAHGNQEDVTVLTQDDLLSSNNEVLSLLTQLITAVAAVSLLVGGIGIMNIMLVAVSERTSEIGIRKAVGATNSQILGQFLVEAVVLSFAGGILGIIAAIAVNMLIRILTSLQPALSLPVIGLSVAVSVLVGVVFGIAPAVKAARKHPIDALRQM